MRRGENPNRNKEAATYTDIVMTCVTHLPNQVGYHAKRLEVIQTCLESQRRGHEDKTMVVWDNASCDALREWLQYEFKPDILILSENLGKNQARCSIAHMLPADRIMTYSDDDIFFYPGWMEEQLEILGHFPNVSCVSGYPIRTSFRWGCGNTIKWAEENAKLDKGRFLPKQWEDDFAVSIGRDIQDHVERTVKDFDYRVTYKRRRAYCTSHHCQFISPVRVIRMINQYAAYAMPDEKPFDIAMDQIGLRLSTTERYTRHMGNVIDDALRNDITEAWQSIKE